MGVAVGVLGRGVVGRQVELKVLVNVLEAGRAAAFEAPVAGANALAVHFEADNDLVAALASPAGRLAVAKDNRVVIVQEVARAARGRVGEAQLEAGGVVLAGLVDSHEAGGARQVVDNPLNDVAVTHHLLGPVELFAGDLARAEEAALVVLAHVDVNVGSRDAVAAQHLANVERHILAAEKATVAALARRWTDEGEVEVGKLELGVVGVDFVHEQGDLFLVGIALYGPACKCTG